MERTFILQSTTSIIEQPRLACMDLNIKHTAYKPSYELETMSGELIVQSLAWQKTIIEVSGSGIIKPQFDEISSNGTYTFHSFMPTDYVHNVPTDTVITIPTNLPLYSSLYSIDNNGIFIIQGENIDGSFVTGSVASYIDGERDLTIAWDIVAPNKSIHLIYYPKYSVRVRPIDPPSYSPITGQFSWSISMRTL